MGPGFLEEIQTSPIRRRAYKFWYHPYTELGILLLVTLSVLLLIIELSLPSGQPAGWLGGATAGDWGGWLVWTDLAITCVFVVEYLSKLWIAPSGRKWFFIRSSWVELLAILPVLRFLRLFRVFRLARLFRVLRLLRSARMLRATKLLANSFQSFGSDLQKNRTGNAIIIVYFLGAMLFGTVGILTFERGAGSGFETLGDGMWWAVVTLSTVGYGDIVPVTTGGRIVASFMVIMGLGLWSVLAGVLASTLLDRLRNKRSSGMDILGITSHVVICGWNENGPRLIRDFRSSIPQAHIVIISRRDDLGIRLDSHLHHLWFDPYSAESLTAAQPEDASALVILAERRGGEAATEIDARSVLVCLALRKLGCEARVVVELLDGEHKLLADNAGADDVIVVEEYAGTLLSQAVQSPGITRAFEELFEAGVGSHFQEVGLDAEFQGQSFSRVSKELFERYGVCLVALRRGQEMIVSPTEDPPVEREDRAIVIRPLAEGSSYRGEGL